MAALVCTTLSCSSNPDDILPPPDPGTGVVKPPDDDSITVMVYAGAAILEYKDHFPRPVKMYHVLGGPQAADTTWFYYNNNLTINRAVSLHKHSSSKSAVYPVYSGGKIVKLYYKEVAMDIFGNYDDALLSQPDPYRSVMYDSFTYDNRNRLLGHYRMYEERTGPAILDYVLLDYFNPATGADTLLYSAKYYQPGGAGQPGYVLANRVVFHAWETTRRNPVYYTLPEYAYFTNFSMVGMHLHPVTNPSVNDGSMGAYIALSPYPIKKIELRSIGLGDYWYTYDLLNSYNLDGVWVRSENYGSIDFKFDGIKK